MTVFKLHTPEGVVDGILAYPNGVIRKSLVGRKFTCDWIDGKGRTVTVENIPAKQARKLGKIGQFSRYSWMVGSIVQKGRIEYPYYP